MNAKDNDEDELILDDSDAQTSLFGRKEDGSTYVIPAPKRDSELHFVRAARRPEGEDYRD